MKKMFALAACGVVLAAAASVSAAAHFTSNLRYGTVGSDEVRRLQEFLALQGVYAGPVTGNFLSLTQTGVKAFQAREGLPTTGYFGPQSRARANTILLSGTVPGQSDAVTLLNSLLVQVARLEAQLRALQVPPATSSPSVSQPGSVATGVTVVPTLPAVAIEGVSPLLPTTVGRSSGQTIGVFKVIVNGTAPIYLENVSFVNAGAATTSISYDLRASAMGAGAGDSSIVYVTASPTTAFGDVTTSPAVNRKIDGGSWRYLTIKTNGSAAHNDTFQLGVTAVGNVSYSVSEADLGYNANPSANSNMTDTISGLPMTGLPTLATVTARD